MKFLSHYLGCWLKCVVKGKCDEVWLKRYSNMRLVGRYSLLWVIAAVVLKGVITKLVSTLDKCTILLIKYGNYCNENCYFTELSCCLLFYLSFQSHSCSVPKWPLLPTMSSQPSGYTGLVPFACISPLSCKIHPIHIQGVSVQMPFKRSNCIHFHSFLWQLIQDTDSSKWKQLLLRTLLNLSPLTWSLCPLFL